MILKQLAEGIRNQDWFVVMVEIMIVVVGIFIGLQVDDWNERRLDRVEERKVLGRLHDELLTSIEPDDPTRAQVIVYSRDIGELAEMLLRQAASSEFQPRHCRALRELVITLITFETLPSLDALIASGRLSIIRNELLQLTLVRLNQTIADFQNDVRSISQGKWFHDIRIYEKFVLSPPFRPDSPWYENYGCDWPSMLADPQFIQHLNTGIGFYGRGYVGGVINVVAQAEIIHDEIDVELGLVHREAQ